MGTHCNWFGLKKKRIFTKKFSQIFKDFTDFHKDFHKVYSLRGCIILQLISYHVIITKYNGLENEYLIIIHYPNDLWTGEWGSGGWA